MKAFLVEEMKAFRGQIKLLTQQFPPDFYALFGGSQFVNAFPTYKQALREGYERFGKKDFLVKQIANHEEFVASPVEG